MQQSNSRYLPEILHLNQSWEVKLYVIRDKQFWHACNQLGYPYGPLCQLLLLTGQRRNEISTLQNHAESGVTKIYARYSYFNEKREALNLWAEHIWNIVNDGDSVDNNVVLLRCKAFNSNDYHVIECVQIL